MNLKSAFSLLAAGMFLAACGADEVVNINDEAKEKATITLKVMDNHDGSAVADASIYSAVDDETETSDEQGLSIWEKQVLGDHVFRVSKEGYATILVGVVVDEKGQGNVARVPDGVQPVYMYKTGVSVSGTVLYTDDQGETKAASGVTVFATITAANNPWLVATFDQTEFTAKTDKNGAYSFKDLPEGVAFDISVGQTTIDGLRYNAGVTKVGSANYRAGDAINTPMVKMAITAPALDKVSDNLGKLDTNSAITLTFSSELIADSLEDKWYVVDGSNDLEMVKATLSSDKKTITIKLIDGTWSKSTIYSLYGVAYSKDGETCTITGEQFSVNSAKANVPAKVKGFAAAKDADDPDDYINLTWTAPSTKDRVNDYEVWYKTDLMNSFKEMGGMWYDDDDAFDLKKPMIQVYVSRLLGAESVQFKLVACNADGCSEATDATKALKLPTPAVP